MAEQTILLVDLVIKFGDGSPVGMLLVDGGVDNAFWRPSPSSLAAGSLSGHASPYRPGLVCRGATPCHVGLDPAVDRNGGL